MCGVCTCGVCVVLVVRTLYEECNELIFSLQDYVPYQVTMTMVTSPTLEAIRYVCMYAGEGGGREGGVLW